MLTRRFSYVKYLHMKSEQIKPWDEKSSKSYQCFPFTDAINAYTTIRRTHDKLHRHVSKKLEKWQLSVPKYGVIRQLYNHEFLTLSEISQRIFSGNSNVTTLIDRMERDGLVERVKGGNDRRVKRIRLTEKGLALAPKVVSEYRGFLHQTMTNCLTHKEQQTLTGLLYKVMESIP